MRGLSRLSLGLLVGLAARAHAACTGVLKLEAEDAVLSGTQALTELAGFSGSGYVGGFDESADKITFTVQATEQKLYDLTIRYAGIYGAKRTTVTLNGGISFEVPFEETTSWETASGGQVLLDKGANTIVISNNWGWYLVDYISLKPSAPRAAHQITDTLVNPAADANAYKLYRYLKSIYGKKILSGQQDLTWADYAANKAGKYPALLSVDLMDYSPSRVERGTVGTSMEDAIAHHKKGGVVSVLWHWNAPTGLYDTSEQRWWSGFYTAATDFNVETALADTTNANYTLLVRDIDAIAVQLKKLQTAGLWKLLHDRLTGHHGINNLIWVWNSIAPAWYPGDSSVDIVSADVYSQGNGPMAIEYEQVISLGKDTKMAAATEVGAAPRPSLLQAYQAHWLYFCVWGDSFINNDAWNSAATLKEIYESDYVLTLDEIQGWASTV
ncbi:unnamed protein product [Parascedosporium putredinis]|uniref:Uncharacterized protein n=1 Tax=Parascedosporium putredinis TaxID=1442378 RepID=A0A9P1H121_9PEZI|nr:unnamed protein product [Parascedosporium putredinis]CAI7993345.1 unnamed protein product [Parascedosporium putredinis]